MAKRKSYAQKRFEGGRLDIGVTGPPPVAPKGVPKCPRWFSKDARLAWRRVVPVLSQLELLSNIDAAALETYCLAYADMVQAQRVIDEQGLTFIGEGGVVRMRPEVQIKYKAQQVVKQFSGEFGLTPAARDRISMPPIMLKGDELEDLLG